jgi:Mce-associated membrane protein
MKAGVLAGVIVLAVCAAVWFGMSGHRTSENTALVDVATTTAVADQVGRGIRTVFSYDPSQMDRTSVAAQEVLTGSAIGQYNTLFAQARQTQQVLTTSVRSVGVMELRGDSARLLVFIDRQILRGDQHESASGQLLVTAHRTTDTWRITDIQVL